MNRPTVSFGLLTIALGIALVAPAQVSPSWPSDPAWVREPRLVEAQTTPTGFRFESVRDTPLGRDAVRGDFETGTQELGIQFESTEPGNATALDLTWRFHSLVEYQDHDRDTRPDLADEVVRTTFLPGRLGTTAVMVPQAAGGYVAEVRIPFNVTTPDPFPVGEGQTIPAGTLVIRVALVGATSSVSGRIVEPTQIPISFHLEGFAYHRNTTHVALAIELAASQPIGRDDQGVRLASGAFVLDYVWDSTVRRDGANVPIGATIEEDTQETPTAGRIHNATLLLGYPRGQTVDHLTAISFERFRPTAVAIGEVPSILGHAGAFAAGAAAAAAIVVATWVPKLRKG